MKKYLIVSTLVYAIIEEDTPTRAWSEFATKPIDITKDILFWEKEDLKNWLINNNYKTLISTLVKDIFEIKK